MRTFFLAALLTTFTQVIGVLGIFFVFGYILALLQQKTQAWYRKTVGWKGILWTAWFGTPFHEFGHIIFAKLFRHKISEIRLFSPDEKSGNLGHVAHQYNPRNLYQQIGNFFVGAAPMIFGTIMLSLFVIFLLPNGKEIFGPLTQARPSFLFLASLAQTLRLFFSWENLQAWNFWLFLYLSFCVVGHIAPSEEDRRGMWKGFVWLILLLLLINIITLLFSVNLTATILKVNQYLGIVFAMFIYATIIALFHFLLVSAVLGSIYKIKSLS